ncbi:MAG: TIGR03084 family protein [Actinobacteria bacterium]|nr:TIGR03084 family protein [Actinomycetota bacterium]
MVDLEELCADLAAEHQALDDVLGDLRDDQWDAPTPAPGWSVRDQISHLAFFDEQAQIATADPAAFAAALGRITDVDAFMNEPLERGRAMTTRQVHEWWSRARGRMLAAFERADPATRIPWFGPAMSPASFISARLMETWAHGQDIIDSLAIDRAATGRLRHIAHVGVLARRNSYAAHGRPVPDGDVRVELEAPGGEKWRWNEAASDSVRGDAVDFCLVVTQRRHVDDTDLVVDGELAREWMSIAQAFAGPPGEGRRPGQFPKVRT